MKAGRHAEADALAARHERAAGQAHGSASEAALHWTEVRADLAMFAGDPVRSCRAWLTVAAARLGAGQAPDAPAVEAAVDRAHHQWGQIHDPGPARELGVTLAELRSRVPAAGRARWTTYAASSTSCRPRADGRPVQTPARPGRPVPGPGLTGGRYRTLAPVGPSGCGRGADARPVRPLPRPGRAVMMGSHG
ncbi:hypothetical protein SFUMM280S_07930 [Streptomyces fumanus]